jgi:hypothetical protein
MRSLRAPRHTSDSVVSYSAGGVTVDWSPVQARPLGALTAGVIWHHRDVDRMGEEAVHITLLHDVQDMPQGLVQVSPRAQHPVHDLRAGRG